MEMRTMMAGSSMGENFSRERSLIETKKTIRQQMIRRLGEQSSLERQKRSFEIQERLLSTEEFKGAATVMAYASLPQEVDTGYFIQEALKQGKKVGVPYILSGGNNMIASEIREKYRLEKGAYGIQQPEASQVKAIPLDEIDLIIVPALAYDRNNMRLGRGKGFYDTFLSLGEKHNPKTIPFFVFLSFPIFFII